MNYKYRSVVFSIALLFGGVSSAHAIDPLAAQWAFDHLGVYRAWEHTVGSRSVVVAVIDNGFDMLHPDIRANAWQNSGEIDGNGIDDDQNGYIDDIWGWSFVPEDTNKDGVIDETEEGGSSDPRPRVHALTDEQIAEGVMHHGTAVAGLIGAVGGNGIGISGVAQQVRLMNLRVVDENGRGSLAMLDEAIRYAVDNGADIINMSLVGTATEDISNAVAYAHARGVVLVAAAGNTQQNLDESPLDPICADATSSVEKILGVSSVNEEHRLSPFSNRGATCIDLTAPGDGLTSTVRFSPEHGLSDLYLGDWHGTSFAAPLVSGAAALIKSIQPAWGPADIYTALLSTVHHTPGQDEVVYAQLFGAGLLQVDKAVAYAFERVTRHSLVNDVLFISPGNGSVQTASGAPIDAVSGLFFGVDDVVAYRHEDMRGYVVARPHTRTERLVTWYDESWRARGSFLVPSTSPVRLATMEDVVVVAPTGPSTVLFWRYTVDGINLSTTTVSRAHAGVSIAISEDGTVYALTSTPTPRVQIIRPPYRMVTDSFDISSSQAKGHIAVGDIDGDQTEEIAIGGAPGYPPMMAYYEQDGSVKRTFSVYGSYTGGYSLERGDYDKNGKDDIIVVPYDNTQPVRVWTDTSKKLVEWYTFGQTSVTDQIAGVLMF